MMEIPVDKYYQRGLLPRDKQMLAESERMHQWWIENGGSDERSGDDGPGDGKAGPSKPKPNINNAFLLDKRLLKQSAEARKSSVLKAYNPGPARKLFDQMSKGNIIEKFAYGLVDPFVTYGTSLFGESNHLNGDGANNRDITEAGVGVWSNLLPVSRIEYSFAIEGKSIVNAAQYNKIFAGKGSNSRIPKAVKIIITM